MLRLRDGLVERGAQVGLGLGEADHAACTHPAREQLLVVVDVLAALGVAGEADGQLAVPPGLGDGGRTAVADDDGGALHGVLQVCVVEQGAAPRECGRVRVAVLDKDVEVVVTGGASVGQPGVDPVDRPVEGVVVGADGDEYEPSARGTRERAHIRLPTSSEPR